MGALLGEDGKSYMFRRGDVHEVWFHELEENSFRAAAAAAHAIGKSGLEVWTTDRTPGVVAFLAAGLATLLLTPLVRRLAHRYDILDRLIQETTGLGTVQYDYDALGRRTSMDAPAM